MTQDTVVKNGREKKPEGVHPTIQDKYWTENASNSGRKNSTEGGNFTTGRGRIDHKPARHAQNKKQKNPMW